ncbi:hypothetical protein [Nocardiopsis sp. Huas11]|uniref:hypothetical protein n=1 Tax=Nocardiopsis sp. Huas11 TaxID=2183912 RepID=UPI000EAF42F5|nr:hypothetical protein [Nocardiopsis sp. Huas11]
MPRADGWTRTAVVGALVIAALSLTAVLGLLVTPADHHLGSHERSPCHPLVPVVFHPDDPRFRNERLNSWTREQCALARRERATTVVLAAVPLAAPVVVGVCGLLVRGTRLDSAPDRRAS